MKKFIDTESGNIITESELKAEFDEMKAESPDEYNYSFGEYIRNCTAKNGFLKEIKNLCVCDTCLAAIESHEGSDTKRIILTIRLYVIGAKWKHTTKSTN